jgi:hypothetical protein
LVPALCAAQDLTPRAYFPTPVSSNAVILTYAFSDGDVVFDPTLPVTDSGLHRRAHRRDFQRVRVRRDLVSATWLMHESSARYFGARFGVRG